MRDPNGRRRGANSAGSAERTRILVPAEQGNRVRVPDTERICFLGKSKRKIGFEK